jgi:hypothetical protein
LIGYPSCASEGELHLDQTATAATAALERPVLYGTVTQLAFNINERYYRGLHYMWCTPCFDIDLKSPVYTVPPTSSPFQIYQTLAREVAAADLHSEKINANRVGIQRGALKMLERGVIDQKTAERIQNTAIVAPVASFRPLLCVISADRAHEHCTEVDITAMANPLSQEFIVEDLPRTAFDVISIGTPQ